MAKKKQKKAKAASKKRARKAVKLAARKPAAKKANGNGHLPRVSSKAFGQDGKALTGVRILDFTHVQSGPTCTQLLAWIGADVIKVERPGVGDITRGQLVDVKGADSLYFTMLNHNKRSITINSKHPQGKRVLDALIKKCDVLVENFAPGALDRMGLTWELHPQAQPAHDRRFGQGLRPRSLRGLQGLRERRAMRRRLGFDHRFPRRPAAGHRRADRRQRHRPTSRARHRLGALSSATAPAAGKRCSPPCRMACSISVASSCAISSASKAGPLTEYSQYGEGVPFGAAVPRAGNDSGGGQPGWILKCKGWETDPDAYIYFITQAPVWAPICDLIGEPTWKTDPEYATPRARLPKLKAIFRRIEQWTMTMTKFEVMEKCNAVDIPVGPILSMKEIAEEPSLRKTGTVVEVDHPTRGKYLIVGNPIKMSDSISEVKRSPLLGEHTDEILKDVLGFKASEINEIKNSGALSAPKKEEKAA